METVHKDIETQKVGKTVAKYTQIYVQLESREMMKKLRCSLKCFAMFDRIHVEHQVWSFSLLEQL